MHPAPSILHSFLSTAGGLRLKLWSWLHCIITPTNLSTTYLRPPPLSFLPPFLPAFLPSCLPSFLPPCLLPPPSCIPTLRYTGFPQCTLHTSRTDAGHWWSLTQVTGHSKLPSPPPHQVDALLWRFLSIALSPRNSCCDPSSPCLCAPVVVSQLLCPLPSALPKLSCLAARGAFADSAAARHRILDGGSHSRDLPIGIRLVAHLQLSLVLRVVHEKLLHGPLVRRLQPLRDLRVGLRHAHSRVQIHPDNLADHLTQDTGR